MTSFIKKTALEKLSRTLYTEMAKWHNETFKDDKREGRYESTYDQLTDKMQEYWTDQAVRYVATYPFIVENE